MPLCQVLKERFRVAIDLEAHPTGRLTVV